MQNEGEGEGMCGWLEIVGKSTVVAKYICPLVPVRGLLPWLFATLFCLPLAAADPTLLGSEEALHEALASQVTISLGQSPARPFLGTVSRSQRIAIFLDRRIDPGTALQLRVVDQPLKEALQAIADSLEASVSFIESVVYIGPPSTDALSTLTAVKRDEAARLPAAAARIWLHRDTLQWAELAVPRELLRQLADVSDITLGNLAAIPHDLWPSTSLPPLPLIDRFSIVLAGFGMTLDVAPDGRTADIVPAPPQVSLNRDYPARRLTAARLSDLREQFPQSEIARRGARLIVAGSYADHRAIQQALQGRPRTTPRSAQAVQRHTLEVENTPVGSIVKAVAASAKLEVEVANGAQAALDTLVSFQVENVSLDELLKAALRPAGLTFTLNRQRLNITRE